MIRKEDIDKEIEIVKNIAIGNTREATLKRHLIDAYIFADILEKIELRDKIYDILGISSSNSDLFENIVEHERNKIIRELF